MRRVNRSKFLTLTLASALSTAIGVSAEEGENSLIDRNGDGKVSVACFGDSITYGIGDDGLTAEEGRKGGWPDRTELLVGVPFDNEGIPGEQLTAEGAVRFVSLAAQKDSDLVMIFEGANDAFRSVSPRAYRDSLQRVVNVAVALGKRPVVMTLPTPCCNHTAQALASDRFSDEIKGVAASNELTVVDIKRAWETTCVDKQACELYNLPEGLHPTARGYEVISQTAAAALLGIDIFSPNGAAELETALGLPAGSVIVRPDPAIVE